MASKHEKSFISYNHQPIAVKIYREARTNTRFSIAKNAAIIRMPSGVAKREQIRLYKEFEKWTKQQFDTNEALRARFFGRLYQNGDELEIFGRRYQLDIQKVNRKTHAAKINKGIIHIELSAIDETPFIQNVIKTLLSRTIAHDCLPELEQRVDAWNDAHFQETINHVRLKNNQSNWGSCSSNRNLNFSTRLLFAPFDVIDYVIVHELAHLKELNHSPRFWSIVSAIMPNYKDKEKWLKENGSLCSF